MQRDVQVLTAAITGVRAAYIRYTPSLARQVYEREINKRSYMRDMKSYNLLQ